MTAPRAGDPEAGFTVVELVVCLGLLALMSALLGAGMAMVKRGSITMTGAERSDDARAARAHLERTLQEALPIFATEPGQAARLVFSGGPHRLQLIVHADAQLEGDGLVLVEFFADEEGKKLVTTRLQVAPEMASISAPAEHVLLDETERLSIRYFGLQPRQAQPAWANSWTNPDHLPELIEVQLEARNLGWPPLIVGVRASHGLAR